MTHTLSDTLSSPAPGPCNSRRRRPAGPQGCEAHALRWAGDEVPCLAFPRSPHGVGGGK